MNIWLLTIGEPLPIEKGARLHRTGIFAETLLARGHQVTWWTSAFDHQRKVMLFEDDRELKLPNGLMLIILRGCGYARNIAPKRFVDHRIIAAKFRRRARHFSPPDLIVASMPCYNLAFEGVRYAREHNVPIIVDIRDLWPDIFLNPLKGALLKRLGRVALTSEFSRLKKAFQQADGLVAVSQGYLDWALERAERAERSSDRVIFLGYEGIRENVSAASPEWLCGTEHQKKILFIGSFGASYELNILIKAARAFQVAGDNRLCFVIAGTGDQDRQIREAASGLSNVVLPGWIGAADIQALLQKGYVGVLPYVQNAPQGIPNKPFEYLSAGLPLISSLKGEMADLIDRYDLGVNYEPDHVEGLINAIRSLVDSEPLYRRLSDNARSFFCRYGNAANIYDSYAEYIESFRSKDETLQLA